MMNKPVVSVGNDRLFRLTTYTGLCYNMGYKNWEGKTMINGKNIIALCTSRIYDPQLNGFIRDLNERLLPLNCRVLIYTLNCDLYWVEDNNVPETAVFGIIPYDRLECLILMDEKIKSRTVAERIISRARENSVPVIVIDGHYEGTAEICFDYEGGFENVVRHVIEGHSVKKTHFIAGHKGNKFSEARIDIFRKVLTENGLEFTPEMVSYGDFWADPARAAAQRLIDSGDIPDAVICANDIMAINVCDVFVKAGIKVPEQVIVTGFDGIEEALRSVPAVSTAGCDYTELADAVRDSVAALLNGEGLRGGSVLPRLSPNTSCGCEYIPPENATLDSINNVYYRYQDNIREFHDIASGMQQATSPEEAASFLAKSLLMHDLCCIADKGCFENRENFFFRQDAGTEHCVFFDSYHPDRGLTDFSREEFIPDCDRRFATGFPLIFNILDYMGKPFGCLCFSFDNYHIIEYTKTASITDTVCMGLGGYVNMRFQKYLSEKVDAELKVAAQVQLNMLTRDFPRHERYDVAASMIPAKSIGGDFYDFFHTDGSHVALVMADVSGKGVPAALFMAVFKMMIHERALMTGTPAEILEYINNRICENNPMGMFITIWLGLLDLNTGIITYANAGHEYPAVRRGNGSFELIKSDNYPPVGTVEDMEYEDLTIDLSGGGSIFLYTDGVTDVKNTEGEHFGLERTLELLNSTAGSPGDIIGGMNRGVDEFSGGAERFDDTTMMCVSYV